MPILKKISLSIILIASISEIAIHLFNLAPNYQFYPGISIPDQHTTYRLKANYIGRQGNIKIKTNSMGLRGEDQPQPEHSKKILCLGDSYLFGWGIPFQDIITEQLKIYLNENMNKTQVINAGVPGYNLDQYISYLNHYGIKFSPDIVIIFITWDDFMPTMRISDEQGNIHLMGISSYLKLIPGDDFFYRHSGLYRFIKTNMKPIFFPYKKRRFSPSASDTKEGWTRASRIIHQTDKKLKEKGAKLLIVDLTMSSALTPLLKGVSVLKINNLNESDFLPNDGHINTNGHKKIAKALNKKLKTIL